MMTVPGARPTIVLMATVAAVLVAPPTTFAQRPRAGTIVPADPAPPYAQVADLVLRSPVIIDATIRRTQTLKGVEAAGAAPGRVRLYVEADVLALVRGTDSVPARIGYLLDVIPDARGKIPKLNRLRVLLYARAVPGKANQIQLTGLDSQRPWAPALDTLSRQIATEALAPDAPPIVTGVGNAFHVPGSLPGEGETQIFLTTRDNRPVSLSILRRPGEQPRWSVALSEIVDEAAAAPVRDTLLWYRLACALPAQLPPASLEKMSGSDAATAQEDYTFVIRSLGRCNRS